MFHDQHVSHKWHVFVILLFLMSSAEPPVGISCVGSFPVQTGGSLIIFPSSLGVRISFNFNRDVFQH